MDSRKYDPIRQVSPGVFTTEQRRRLEAYTAVVALRPGAEPSDQIMIASFIIDG